MDIKITIKHIPFNNNIKLAKTQKKIQLGIPHQTVQLRKPT